MIEKIISGGQTGADQGGLEAGRILGISTGGYCPKGWRTEKGPQEERLKSYGLTEHCDSAYPPRTRANVHNSDGTVWFGNQNSPGGKLTIRTCHDMDKDFIINPNTAELLEFIELNNIHVLNVAGNRESTNPGIQEKVKCFLVSALRGAV